MVDGARERGLRLWESCAKVDALSRLGMFGLHICACVKDTSH